VAWSLIRHCGNQEILFDYNPQVHDWISCFQCQIIQDNECIYKLENSLIAPQLLSYVF